MTWKLGSALILSASLLSPEAFAGEAYDVSATLSHEGREFASPSLVVKAGEAASISTSGPDGYALSITVDPLADGTLRVSSRVNSDRGDMAPVLVVEPGATSSVSVGELSLSLTATLSDG